MNLSARFGAAAAPLALALLVMGCSKKGPECQTLISSMNDLGTKLAEAQKVTSNNDAKPDQVAAALRPFGGAAKGTGDKLAATQFTVPEIKKIAADASAASLALASSANSMAEAADQMKGLDAATKAVEDQKKIVDGAEAEIKKICDGNAAHCVELGKVLVAFPPPPDKTDNPQATAAWTGKLATWAADLSKVEIKDAALKGHVTTFEKAWKSFGAAMTTLVGISETAKKYDDFAKTFNTQIDAANKAIGEANSSCRG
jgi:hypothetical protein